MDCAGDNGRGRLRPARWAGEQGQLMVGFVRVQFCSLLLTAYAWLRARCIAGMPLRGGAIK